MRHGFEQDMLVAGVRAFADGTEAVQGGDAESGGEIAVGCAASRGFAESKAHLFGERFGASVEFNAVLAFERRAIEAAAQLKLDAASDGFQSAKSFFHRAHIGMTPGAKIEIDLGAVGNHVGASAAIDEVGIDGNAVARVVPLFNTGDLRGEFMNRIDAPVGIQASVSGASMHDERGFANALAGSLDHATRAEGRLENKNRVAVPGFRFKNLA